MSVNVFSVPIFFVLFRETLEAAVIVSVLLAFLYQVFSDNPDMQRKLRLQVWLGTIFGLLISIAIGAAFIAIWYTVANNLWKTTELLWEGSFCLIATVFVTIMAIAMLKTNKVQDKWKFKLSKAMEARMSEKKNEQDNDDVTNGKTGFLSKWKQGKHRIKGEYAFFFLPFITVLREGLEAMVFMGGVSMIPSLYHSMSCASVPDLPCCSSCLHNFLPHINRLQSANPAPPSPSLPFAVFSAPSSSDT
ncbi:iron permease FTR1 family-domain-containing protein [Jimgerdemannia flammicorona]|uniref:Iron permease FTR1 family-domain-containing protein n=1 Tax=Jimgerdemannia flammicorona TaxID=994334 RepID=A0A433DDM3_9FUNG|nr:iron permease FTR1 family-domain-containing protein [Jimgerdemannia flammicorona]